MPGVVTLLILKTPHIPSIYAIVVCGCFAFFLVLVVGFHMYNPCPRACLPRDRCLRWTCTHFSHIRGSSGWHPANRRLAQLRWKRQRTCNCPIMCSSCGSLLLCKGNAAAVAAHVVATPCYPCNMCFGVHALVFLCQQCNMGGPSRFISYGAFVVILRTDQYDRKHTLATYHNGDWCTGSPTSKTVTYPPHQRAMAR